MGVEFKMAGVEVGPRVRATNVDAIDALAELGHPFEADRCGAGMLLRRAEARLLEARRQVASGGPVTRPAVLALVGALRALAAATLAARRRTIGSRWW
jgi:hypothetical protein